MSETEPSNLFAAPPRTPPGSAEDFKTRALEAWLRSLPTANIESALPLFYARVEGLNRVEISASDRFKVLELCRPVLDSLLAGLSQKYMANPSSVSPRDRRFVDLGQRLRAQMVIGYKIVLGQLAKTGLGARFLHRATLLEALQRVLDFLEAMLLIDYQRYEQYTPFLWKEAHEIYAYARRHHLEGKTLEGQGAAGVAPSSVEGQYKRLLLLAVADPYRLKQGEILEIHRWLRGNSGLCRLIPHGSQGAMPGSILAVDRNSDQPPTYLNRFSGKAFQGWLLDISALAQRMEAQLNGSGKGDGGGGGRSALPAELLERLMLAWGVNTERGRHRETSSGQVLAVYGVTSIHRVLQAAAVGGSWSARPVVPGDAASQGRTGPAQAEPGDEPSPPLQHPPVETIDLHAEDARKPSWSSSNGARGASPVALCELLDSSANGYGLRLPTGAAFSPQVGGLMAVALVRPNRSGQVWCLAVVRWVRLQRSGGKEFGVQIIDGKAQPITVERIRGNGNTQERWPCLLLRGPAEPKSSLITPAFFPHPEDRFFLLYSSVPVAVQLGARVEATAAFSHFHVTAETD